MQDSIQPKAPLVQIKGEPLPPSGLRETIRRLVAIPFYHRLPTFTVIILTISKAALSPIRIVKKGGPSFEGFETGRET